jgi:hypothetical protein
MNSRFMLLILFLCVIASANYTFAANATHVGTSHAHMVPIESRNQPLLETGSERSGAIGSKSGTSHTTLGYLDDDPPGISPGIRLGNTDYDFQHYSRMARQVAVGADGRVHFVWTDASAPFDPNSRAIYYQSYLNGVLAGQAFNLSENVSPEKTPGRYCAVDVSSNRALVVNHFGNGPATTSALDAWSGTGAFTAIDPPSTVVNREGILTNGAITLTNNYIWPVVAADQDGSGKLVIHVAAMEGNTVSGSWKAITYFRGLSSGVNMEAGMYGTAGMFVDSCQAIGYDIAASPYDERVIIAYPKSRQADRENNDLAYRLSNDRGETWGPVVNITYFPTEAKERCGQETSVLFTPDGCFHILYIGSIYDSLAGTVSDQEAKLYHWSSCNPTQRSLVLDANNHDNACTTPAFEYNICKINLTQCHSTSLDRDLLYAVYSRQLGMTDNSDCSDKGYFNKEVFMSPSSTMGETWGAPVNLTNTMTNGCFGTSSSYCADDRFTSSARYVTDSLRIEYMEDLDAGSFVGDEPGTADLNNPIKFLSFPCIDMAPYQILSCTPSAIGYPFHAVRNATATQDLLLVNGGNLSVAWTSSIIDGGAGWISVPASGTVPAGYTNSATITATVGPRSTEGLYHGAIRFTYDGGSSTLDVLVDFYVFDYFPLPEDVSIRTTTAGGARMVVNQAGQAADDVMGQSFTYFADLTKDYITDASLIMGNSSANLSWLIFNKGQGNPTPSNNFGRLYALSNITVDSTTYPYSYGYTIAQGSGTNRDSTVAFSVKWYAPHHLDSADFFVGHFDVYKGAKNPTGTVTGLDIAFGCDWDIPSDSSFDNIIGYDSTMQMIYLQGMYTDARRHGFAGTAAYREDGTAIPGGFAWGNRQQVYRQNGFQVDSVWKYMQAISPAHPYNSLWKDSIGDMSIVMVVAKNYAVTPTSHLKFDIVLAAKRAEANPTGGVDALKTAVCKSKEFIKSWIDPTIQGCSGSACTSCGDVDGDQTIDISDIVFLISYIFGSGSAPPPCGSNPIGTGNVDGCGIVNVADARFLISYVFSAGPAPHDCENTDPCSGTPEGAVKIGCQTFYVYPGGDSIAIPIYLSNTVDLTAFSLGFHYNTSSVEITSINTSGSQIPTPDYGEGFQALFKPAENQVLIGGLYKLLMIPAGSEALILKLNARILSGGPSQLIPLDTMFVPPAGDFILKAQDGDVIVPVFVPARTGDASGDGNVDIADAVYLIAYIFSGGSAPAPLLAGDASCDGSVDISDAVYLISYIFSGGPAPCGLCK